ncbi:serine/threonine-protein kinase [Nocardiopsis prasina]|uniref:serine/threonine-protein kinase n=1 Tax=Nocardiopsis prasina TaxID=2015 RepID=UPI00034C617C|nr:serine/threonine-protein kinase [Nocardiopsis prasina]
MDETTDLTPAPRAVGPYTLTRSLGRGGFGEVFLGEAGDGTRAAVKLLHANWSGDADMRRRFAAEVEQARRVSGFCIAEILDADPDAAQPWIATEFIDGPTLHRAVTVEGPRTGAELQRLAIATATALAAIHAAGVVHRDLKPDNIMLAPDGPRVIDFGIARAVESTSVTASGIVGTVGYMAPEQLEGMRLTAAVDVFSWASVLVFAGTGRDAFHGPTQAARIAKVLSGEPDTGDLSGPLLGTILACLDKNPKRRPDAPALLHHLVAGTVPTPDGRTADQGAAGPTPTPEPPPHHAAAPPSGRPAYLTPPPSLVRSQNSYGPPAPDSDTGEEAPPYRFAGVRFSRIEPLAAAMQEHWSEAVMVLGDPAERAMLGSWVMNDINDTKVDRSLFRREVRDANLAVASFVAQASPDLPPLFRGHELSLAGLRQLFHDPRPLITGGHEANELMLLARPQLLRQMSEHRHEDAPELRRLAEDVEEAERTGMAFHRELAQNLNGWRGFEGRMDPALALTFLLNPDLMVPPDPGDMPGAADWTSALWSRVELASGAQRAGYAAAVYGSLSAVVTLIRQRGVWATQRESLRREHDSLAAEATEAGQISRIRSVFVAAAIIFFFLSLVLGAAMNGSGLGTLFFLSSLAAGGVALIMVFRENGSAVREARDLRLRNIPLQGQALAAGLRSMDADIRRARELCSRPPRKAY